MEPNKNEHNKIEELQKNLYRQDAPNIRNLNHDELSQKSLDVEKDWMHEAKPPVGFTHQPTVAKVSAGSFFKKIFIGATIFFIIAAGLMVYSFVKNWNIVSSNKISLTFIGPVSVAAGDEFAFDVVAQNDNSTALLNAEFYIDYPGGTKEVTDLTKDLLHEKRQVGVIEPQTNSRITAKSVLFGAQHTQKQIKVTLYYTIQGSDTVFKKEQTFDVSISTSPLTMVVSKPQEIPSGNQAEFTVEITSNSSVPLTDILLKAQYSFGFAYQDSTPTPTYDNNGWLFKTINPGEKKIITVRGTIEGEEADERSFHFSVGAQNKQNPKLVATEYLRSIDSVTIKKPPLALMVYLNDSANKEVPTRQGEEVLGLLEFTNNLPDTITDATIRIVFDGNLFNPLTANPGGDGFYRSGERLLFWDKITKPQLRSLAPGDKVAVAFSFSTLSPEQVTAIKNGSMGLTATVSAIRISNETDETLTVSTSQKRIVKTQTSTNFTSRLVYSFGPFKNTGPVPPRVEQKTTYTVIWSIANSTNALTGAEVKARIPVYVRWMGNVSPSSEQVVWNKDTNEIMWRAGDVPATGSGIAKEVAFQVEVLPGLGQRGGVPEIVSGAVFKAVDTFTNLPVGMSVGNLNTYLHSDPMYRNDPGRIRE